MHTKTKGAIAELAVASWLISNQWRVLFPFGENSRYDLVAERAGRFVRVQVKYVTPKNGVLPVKCSSTNNWNTKRYNKREIDVIAAYDSIGKVIYFVPVSLINDQHQLLLRLTPTKNCQREGVRFARDFTKLFPR